MISEPMSILRADSFMRSRWLGFKRPDLGIMFMVLNPIKYSDINLRVMDAASSFWRISMVASLFWRVLI